jgi:hypothetical protein
MIMKLILPGTLGLSLLLAPVARAVDFDKEIKPILAKNCYECHSEQKKKEKGGYVFDNVTRFKKDIGVNLQIEPGNPAESHFFEVISDPGVKHHMPPKGSLAQKEIDKIRVWITEGAKLEKSDDKTASGGPGLLPKKTLPPIMTWTNAEGVAIKAGFGGLQGENVLLKMPNGQTVPYPIAKLSADSQRQAKESAGP